MGVLKNDVGRPSNKTIMIRTILKVIILLLIITVVCIAGYYVGNTKNEVPSKTNKNNINSNQNIDKTDPVIEEVSIEEAEQILYGVFNDFYYFDTNEYNKASYKTYIALTKTKGIDSSYVCKDLYGKDLQPYDKYFPDGKSWRVEEGDFIGLCYDENIVFYPYQSVNTEYKKLFGNKFNALKENINADFMNLYAYSEYKVGYSQLSCECGDGGFGVIYGITNSYVKEDKLYIEFVHEFYDSSNLTIKLSNDDIVSLTEEETKDENAYKKYQDKMDKYQFVFFKEDNIYKFESVEKIK